MTDSARFWSRPTACLLQNDPASCYGAARLSSWKSGAAAKASPNRANELRRADPKPGDLPMARMKST